MNQSPNDRERYFHDRWATNTPLSEIRVIESFENITAQENRFILKLMGNIDGLRILDVGAGLGESSVYFALNGAKVTASDISTVMLDRTLSLARLYGVSISTQSCSNDNYDFGTNKFDIVYGANLLHHLVEIRSFLNAIKIALVPGGKFYFWDPLVYNPIIKIYRRLAKKVRTQDEQPLRFSDVKIFRDYFQEVHHKEFWLTTLVIFLKYFFINKMNPNEFRYWKKILSEDPNEIAWWFAPLNRFDTILLRFPLLKYLSWNMLIWGKN
jgi:SAM-dependent methyltransferase